MPKVLLLLCAPLLDMHYYVVVMLSSMALLYIMTITYYLFLIYTLGKTMFACSCQVSPLTSSAKPLPHPNLRGLAVSTSTILRRCSILDLSRSSNALKHLSNERCAALVPSLPSGASAHSYQVPPGTNVDNST